MYSGFSKENSLKPVQEQKGKIRGKQTKKQASKKTQNAC